MRRLCEGAFERLKRSPPALLKLQNYKHPIPKIRFEDLKMWEYEDEPDPLSRMDNISVEKKSPKTKKFRRDERCQGKRGFSYREDIK